jgi:hypothetical protein
MSATTRTEAERPSIDALAGAMLLASLSASIATVALPTLAQAFSAPVSDVR